VVLLVKKLWINTRQDMKSTQGENMTVYAVNLYKEVYLPIL